MQFDKTVVNNSASTNISRIPGQETGTIYPCFRHEYALYRTVLEHLKDSAIAYVPWPEAMAQVQLHDSDWSRCFRRNSWSCRG